MSGGAAGRSPPGNRQRPRPVRAQVHAGRSQP
jgi:hypothetical protein